MRRCSNPVRGNGTYKCNILREQNGLLARSRPCKVALQLRSKQRANGSSLKFTLVLIFAILSATIHIASGQTFTRITEGDVVNDGGQSDGSSWGDYDNDGDLDLFVANDNGNNFLYQNNGDGTFAKISTGVIVNDGGGSRGSSWGDYDNDGDLDLFVANTIPAGASENNFLYQNNGNSNNWINLKLVGTLSNVSAIGAKVRVRTTIGGNPSWQLNEISAGQTGWGQNSLNAEFGLGDATIIDEIRIEWPSGIVQVLTNVGVDQFLTITEEETAIATISGEITYPDNQLDFPNGKIFIPVWKNPSSWPFPPENEYPIVEEIINAPGLNYPVNYTVEVTDVAPGDWYYVAAFFDEDTTMQPQKPEAEAWYPDGFELAVASAENVNMALGPISGGGYSFDFGATGGYAETDFQDLDGGSQITMEMFIKLHRPYGTGEQYELFRRDGWATIKYDGNAGEFIFDLTNIGTVAWSFSPNSGQWYHLAVDYDGLNMTIYWDGEQKASISPGGGNLTSTSSALRIGNGFDGQADIIRISDISLYYPNNFDPWTQDYNPTSNTRLLYNCNEGNGNQLIDDSGHEHHAEISGDPTWDPDEPFGFTGPSFWMTTVGTDFVELAWDRWPDADQDFVRYELHRNNTGGVTLSDPVVLDEQGINVVSWRDNNVTTGNPYFYKLWMYDQAGVISLNEDWAPGQVHLNLWFPGHNPEFDAPDLSQQWSEDSPFSVGYLFEDPGIYQGGPYNIRAYFDADNNGQSDEGEPRSGANNLYVPSSNELAPVDIELVSGSAGHVEGNIRSDETRSGVLIVGLYQPDNGGNEWDPDFQINLNVTFPSDPLYQFDDTGIYDASGWQVKAFLDQNSNQTPDGDELYGESGQFTVSGGYAVNIDFELGAAPAQQLILSTNRLDFAPAEYSQAFQVRNEGTGTLYWQASVNLLSGSNWLTIAPGYGQRYYQR